LGERSSHPQNHKKARKYYLIIEEFLQSNFLKRPEGQAPAVCIIRVDGITPNNNVTCRIELPHGKMNYPG
jgi:hypothetical protein